MRLRLFHQLFLLIAGSVLLTALAMAFVLSVSLRSGFSEYLKAQDIQQLEEFAEAAATNIAARKASQRPTGDRLNIEALLVDMIRRGEVPNALPPGSGDRPDGGLDDGPPVERLLPTGPRPGRNGTPPGGFARRLMMFDGAGVQVTGPPPPPGAVANRVLERKVVVDGKIVAVAKLLPRRPSPNNVDAGFLKSQYRSAALTILLLLVLAAIPASLIARLGAKRLAAMQKIANAIAKGDLSARVAVRGVDELSAMGRDINTMAESLDVLDTSRRRWMAEISHELRTPLSVLIGELDALKDGVRPLKMVAVESLSYEAQRLGHIVNDLHQLAVADLSGTFCQFAPCDAVGIVRALHSRFEQAFATAHIELGVDCNGLADLPAVWDQPRIGQMLANIMTNSLRYTNGPGRVRIGLSTAATKICIQIDDSAPGVPPEHLERLFEPLYRVEESRDRASGGSGLGLAISEAIVSAHKGSISLANSHLGGLSVKILLPQDAGTA